MQLGSSLYIDLLWRCVGVCSDVPVSGGPAMLSRQAGVQQQQFCGDISVDGSLDGGGKRELKG